MLVLDLFAADVDKVDRISPLVRDLQRPVLARPKLAIDALE